MDLNTDVYVLDDGVMLSGNLFQFDSIEHVAATCLPVVESILKRHHDNTRDHHTDIDVDSAVIFNLGGWSYGGVVAAAVAKLIQNNTSSVCTLYNKLVVNKLILIDSSLRASNNELITPVIKDGDDELINISGNIVILDEVNVVAEESNSTSENEIRKMVTAKSMNTNDDDIATQTNNHFKACIELLKKHHQRPLELKPLICPIYDVRPSEDSTYGCPITAIEELTTGKVTRRMVAGNHWTMLFNEHAVSIAEILKSYLNE
jgi:thioesterase domain-containing protein